MRRTVAPQFVLSIATWLCVLLASGFWATPAAAYKPEVEMRFALYVTISPAWFDPAQVAVVGGTPFWFCYALHDALVKPMPGNPMAPSLAEYWTVSDDQLTYELDSGVFASLCWLTQKALQDGQRITQFRSFLAGRLQQGTRMFVAVLTHHIGQRMHVFLDVGMVQAPLQKY